MTIEEKDRLKIMWREYSRMLTAQEEAYKKEQQEQEEDSDNQWEINGVSPWEL